MKKSRTLDTIRVGEHLYISRLDISAEVAQRMRDLGLVVGAEVRSVGESPLGDPIMLVAGGRVIAVGTTSCRTLESVTDDNGIVQPVSGDTGIFIYPGYRFKAIDALITNFHLPESTLLMLVSAFYNRDDVLTAYRTAVEMEYRFFSFGDAMFIE